MNDEKIKIYIETLSLKSDIEKLKDLDELEYDFASGIINEVDYEHKKCCIIKSFSSEKLRMEKLYKIHDEYFKGEIINTLSNDADRMKYIDEFRDPEVISYCATKLNETHNKIKYMKLVYDNELKLYISDSIDVTDKELIEEIDDIDSKSHEYTRVLLIKKLLDDEIKKQYLSTIERDFNKKIIVLSFQEDKYKLEYLSKIKDSREIIIASLKNDEHKMELLEESCIKKYNEFNIPENMTVGMEVECEGYRSKDIININEIITGWKSKKEDSVEGGVEVISPIMKNCEEDVNNVYNVCNILSNLNQEVSEICGGHIHIGADYLKSYDSYCNLYEIWTNCEKVIYEICNKAYELPRNQVSVMARPFSKKLEDRLDLFRGLANRDEFVKEMKEIQHMRFYGINILNVGKQKNTIEFRIPNGTLNPNVWIENINLFGGIVEAAQSISEIKEKNLEELTEIERNKLESFYKLRENKLSDSNKLKLLLNLCVPKEFQKTYINRFKVNSKLLKFNKKLNKRLNSDITNEKIKFRTEEIGAQCFAGANHVNLASLDKTNNRIKMDIRNFLRGKEEKNESR